MRRALLAALLCLCCFACHRQGQDVPTVKTLVSDGAVTISDVRFYSPAIDRLLWYRIILPNPNGARLPVLYLLPGANSSPAEIMEHSEVANLAIAEHLAVVMPNGELSYYTNAKHRQNARWEDAITHDLSNDVLARFPVLAGRDHTGIAGISMGGYGAAKLSLKHPELYGFTGIVSGALDITRRPASLRRWGQTLRTWMIFGFRRSTRHDEDVFAILSNSPQLRQATWFISCGEKDPFHAVAEQFARQMRRDGAELSLVTTQGHHDWQSWNAALPQMFRRAGDALR